MAYVAILLFVLIAMIPLCLYVFCRVYCAQTRQSSWTLDHGAHNNPAFEYSKDDQSDISFHSYVNKSTQTADDPFRI